MRKVMVCTLFMRLLMAGEIEHKGNFGIEYNYYAHDILDKRDDDFALRGEFEAKKELGNAEFKMKLKGLWENDSHQRRYIDFQELYYKYNLENSELLIGRNILFWGALEVYNLVDVLNTKDTLDDPFDYEKKLGAWNMAWTYFFENSELSFIIRFKEEDQKMQEADSVFNFLPLPYNSDLKMQYKDRPSFFIKYSGSGEEVQIDYTVIYEAGYDEQRYYTYESGKLRQHAYWVDKLMGYTTLVHEDTIYKAEAIYVISDDVKVSDYIHAGIGLEYTLYSIWEKKDLGFLAEYYHYKQFNDTKFSVKELGQLFQNDLYLGGRFSFNDVASSEILAGVDIDLDMREKICFLKYDTRVLDRFKMELQYQHLSPASGSNFSQIDHAKVALSYYY